MRQRKYAEVRCPHCGSPRAHYKRTTANTRSYSCRACGGYFSVPIELVPYKEQPKEQPQVFANKNIKELGWREICKHMMDGQELSRKASFTQDFATIKVDTRKPIVLLPIGDWHLGANGADYDMMMKMTDEILSTNGLYIVLTGDMLETAIVYRNVKEMTNQAEPELQFALLESWLDEIKHKILWATWDNHTVAREEKQTGFSMYKGIIGHDKHIIYHNGIGHVDLIVGKQTYKIVSSHKFNGRSMLNPTHSQMRHMRFESIDREIAISGDTHKVGMSYYYDGDRPRLAINNGTLHTNSGYAKRYFSLFAIPEFPCIEFFPDEHLFIPYKSLGAWKKSKHKIRV